MHVRAQGLRTRSQERLGATHTALSPYESRSCCCRDLLRQVRELAVARRKAPGGKEEALVGQLLALCDKIRDVALPKLGVQVQDGKVSKGGDKERQVQAWRWHFDASLRPDK
jgi:hypothetical protein